jgi:quinol monooxygenase YgiN
MSVHVVSHITARPETLEAVRSIVTGFIAPTREEPGCLSYRLMQNNAAPCEFTFIEEWSSDEALDLHARTPHLSQGVAALAPLLAQPIDLRRYTRLA